VETVLNLLWLTLALAALAHWLVKAQGDSPEQSKALRLTALVMLLVLLFPVISLTDDLQSAATFAEGERAGLRVASNDIHAALQQAQAFTLWSDVIQAPATRTVARAIEEAPLRPASAIRPYKLGQRPPPAHANSLSLDS
jgi:hypothetical protein